MNIFKKILILAILIQSLCYAGDKVKEALIEIKNISADAYYKNDPELFNKALTKCDEILKIDSSNNYAKYYSAYNMFNVIGYIEKDTTKKEILANYITSAENYLHQLSSVRKFKAEATILLEGIYSILVNVYPARKKELTTKISECFIVAIKADSLNPRIYLHSGIYLYFTAKQRKAKTDAAIINYKKALELFNIVKPADKYMPDWGLLETLAFLGRAYDDLGKYKEAELAYTSALKVRPDYVLVSKVLYPALKKKMPPYKN